MEFQWFYLQKEHLHSSQGKFVSTYINPILHTGINAQMRLILPYQKYMFWLREALILKIVFGYLSLTGYHTVIRFAWVSAKVGTCTVESVNGTLDEAKMCIFTLESTDFVFNKCPFYIHDGANAKFSTNSHETVYSAAIPRTRYVHCNIACEEGCSHLSCQIN